MGGSRGVSLSARSKFFHRTVCATNLDLALKEVPQLKIEIVPDGGIGRIESLWSETRWIWALASFCQLALNLGFIAWRASQAMEVRDDWCPDKTDFLFTNRLLDLVAGDSFCFRFPGKLFVAIIETVVLAEKFLCLFIAVFRSLPGQPERWLHTCKIFWKQFPDIMQFSALR